MRQETFTIMDALKIQTEDLARWETVLNEMAYTKLKAQCVKKNLEGYDDAFSVFRGQSLGTYISNLASELYREKGAK